MGRIHAFEFEDLQWFPGNLRNYATDFLQFFANALDMYKEVIPILQKVDKANLLTLDIYRALQKIIDKIT